MIYYVDPFLLIILPLNVVKQNFLFSTKDEHSPMKIIDFGLSDFIRPGITSTQGSSSCNALLFYKYVKNR
jgi:hypothetical protein